MRRLAVIILALAVCTPACQRNKTLAVFDLLDQSGTLSVDQSDQLTEHLTGALGQGGEQRVLPRATTKGLCPDLAPDCLAAQAQKLKAGGYATARVLKIGSECSLVLKFFRAKDRASRASASVPTACDPAILIGAIDLAAHVMLKSDPHDRQAAELAMRERLRREEEKRRIREMKRAEEAPAELERLLASGLAAEEEASRKAQEAKRKAELAVRLAEEPGRLERSQILKVFKRHKPQLLGCLKLHPKLSGPGPLRLRLELTIQPSGKVSEVVAGPEDVFGAVRSCVEKKARRWKFPAYEGRATTVSLPVVMSR